MKEREAYNPGAGIYSHWMKAVHEKAHKALNKIREAVKKCDDRKATNQPNLIVGDQVILHVKDICTKRPLKKLTSKLCCPFKIV